MAQLNDWLSIDKASGTGNAEITLTASSYEELAERTQGLVIKGQKERVYLNIIQAGIVTSATLDSYEITTYQFGGTYSNGITSNVPWTATVDGDWFSIDKTNGEKGHTNLSITINNTTSNRGGSISFYYKTKLLCTLTIEQLNDVPNEYKITYKTTDGNIYVPYESRDGNLVENWGSMNVISNTYKNGIGTIVCDHPIKTVDWYDNNINRRRRLTELNLPEGLEVLNADLSYTSLLKIIFPNTLKELRSKFGNTGITEVTIPQSVEKIGANVFNGCIRLRKAVVNATCFSIGDRFSNLQEKGHGYGIFSGCTSLQNVTLAEGTVCIPIRAFVGCISLENINLPSSIRSIGDYAFSGCKNLIPTFPNNLIKIGNGAYSECSKIENIVLPNSVRYVGNYAFSDCIKIKSIYMNAEIIGERIITGGDNSVLKTIDLGNRLTHMNGEFCNGSLPRLESLHIPNTLKYVHSLNFYPYRLNKEEIGELVNLEYIGGGVEIKGNDPIHLPQSLKYIGGVTAVEDRSQGSDTEQHIFIGSNVKYVGGLDRAYYSDMGIGAANNLYITFESTVPPQMGSGVDASHITNSGGDWDLIKNWGNGDKSTIIEIKYETTDGSKITIPNLSHNVDVVEHTYGSIKIKNGDRGCDISSIFSDPSSQKIKRIILPKECNYGLIMLETLNDKTVYANTSCDIKIDNDGNITEEIDDNVVSFSGSYESIIVGGKETLLSVDGYCLETPKNLYLVGLYGRTLEDKFYTCKLGSPMNYIGGLYSNFYINDKLFENPVYDVDNPNINPNIVFKNEDIEEFYRL